jgi:magnesium-transporting ATPase (P-type)
MSVFMKTWMGRMFSATFLAAAIFLVCFAIFQFVSGLQAGKDLINVFVQSINTGIISLAIFELGIGIGAEYVNHEEESCTFKIVRRTIMRFVGTVCIALVLEALIMIIKYSQLELAGNLNYPVAILGGVSLLLAGLGIFLHLTRKDVEPYQVAENKPGGVRLARAGDLDTRHFQRRNKTV